MAKQEWQQHIDKSWFRRDMAYAGKDHTKNNKTFICINPVDCADVKTGFKTVESAMNYADSTWTK